MLSLLGSTYMSNIPRILDNVACNTAKQSLHFDARGYSTLHSYQKLKHGITTRTVNAHRRPIGTE